jgi:hypothetical protein
MRKANFKTLLVSALVMIAIMLVGGKVGAQTALSTKAGGPLFEYPAKTSFVSSTEAEQILIAHVEALKAYISGLPQGSPAYNTTYRASVYYRAVLQSVQNGKSVANAIVDGCALFVSEYFNGASYSEKLGLRQESIGMLDGGALPVNPNSTN